MDVTKSLSCCWKEVCKRGINYDNTGSGYLFYVENLLDYAGTNGEWYCNYHQYWMNRKKELELEDLTDLVYRRCSWKISECKEGEDMDPMSGPWHFITETDDKMDWICNFHRGYEACLN